MLRGDRPVRAASAFAGLWILSDFLRGRIPFGGFPWGELGLPLIGSPSRWIVPWLGSLALTGVAAAIGGSVWLARRRRVAAAALVMAVVTASLAAWLARPAAPVGPNLRVAAVQGNVPLPVRLASPPRDAQVLANHNRVTSRLKPRDVDLVVWPEAIVQTHTVRTGTRAPKPLNQLAGRLDTWFVAGVSADGPSKRFYNLAVSVNHQGIVAGQTAKVHGVPFGEYVPWRSLLGDKFGLSAVSRDLEPGHRVHAIPIPRGRAAIAISYEVAFSDVLRAGVRDGGRVLLVPTNVSSYGPDSPIAGQELLEARARALEQRMWLVQAAPSGIPRSSTHQGACGNRRTCSSRHRAQPSATSHEPHAVRALGRRADRLHRPCCVRRRARAKGTRPTAPRQRREKKMTESSRPNLHKTRPIGQPAPSWSAPRQAVGLFCRGATFSTAAPTALIVGTVLSLVNQLHVVLDGDATWATWVRVVVNYAVPYIVASVGFLSACRARPGA